MPHSKFSHALGELIEAQKALFEHLEKMHHEAKRQQQAQEQDWSQYNQHREELDDLNARVHERTQSLQEILKEYGSL